MSLAGTHPVTTATFPSSVNLFIVGVILGTTLLSKTTAFRSTSPLETGCDEEEEEEEEDSDPSTLRVVRSATPVPDLLDLV